jgi:hypothetical protein
MKYLPFKDLKKSDTLESLVGSVISIPCECARMCHFKDEVSAECLR